MLQYSDNTATDIILKICGGPQSVMKTMQSIDIHKLKIDKSFYQLLTEQIGISHLINENNFSIEKFNNLEKSLPKEYIDNSISKYELTLKNRTPEEMGRLLNKLIYENILWEDLKNLLLEILSDCKCFRGRIPALLPKNLKIQRKTGTLSPVANDVAIIDFSQGFRLILVIFSWKLNKPSAEKDKFIALIAKAIYDDFTKKHNIVWKTTKCLIMHKPFTLKFIWSIT